MSRLLRMLFLPVLLLPMVSLSGCVLVYQSEVGVRATFIPVAGPAAALQPVPAYLGRLNGLFSGEVKVTLADGERFEGAWLRILPGAAIPAGLQDAAIAPDLVKDWDFVYGEGYYRADVVGSRQHLCALLKGSKGSEALVEVNNPNRAGESRDPVRGVARDSQGNIYKVVFN
jgi:hypothetical protein